MNTELEDHNHKSPLFILREKIQLEEQYVKQAKEYLLAQRTSGNHSEQPSHYSAAITNDRNVMLTNSGTHQ